MQKLTVRLVVLLGIVAVATFAAKLFFARNPLDLPPVALIHERDRTVPVSCFPGLSIKVKDITSAASFRAGAFYPWPEQKESRAEWYSRHLRAMGETSLISEANSQTEHYRFLWLRTFHHPVAVSIWQSGGEQFVSVKQLDGAGGYKSGQLITNERRSVTTSEWDGFTRILEQVCYWRLASQDDEILGEDGSQWILEGRRENRYHLVDRWTPQTGYFREACIYLLKLSQLNIEITNEDFY